MDASSIAMHVLERSETLRGGCVPGRGILRGFGPVLLLDYLRLIVVLLFLLLLLLVFVLLHFAATRDGSEH